MPTTSLPIPINGFSDSANHQHGADGFTSKALNIYPDDNWEHRKRVGVRQGFQAIADMGASDDENVQLLLTYEVYRGAALRREVLIVAGGNTYYADSTGVTTAIAYNTDGASGSVTFTDVPSVGEQITIISTDGTSITYTAATTANPASNEFEVTDDDPDQITVADSLETAINHANGHNAGSDNSVIDIDNDDSGALTLTQVVVGIDGNTEMANDLTNATVVDFVGSGVPTADVMKTYDTVRGVQFGNDVFLVNGRHYYKIDLSAITPEIVPWVEVTGTANPTGLPKDAYDNRCTLISRFGGRIVLAGLSTSRTNWFMSKIGDPLDWTPVTGQNNTAQAGGTSVNFGKLGEPIVAIFPFGEAGLMMAGTNSLTYLTADPVITGAQLIRMSNSVGVIGADSWCQGPEKTCYIVSTDGVYMIQPNTFNIQRGQGVSSGRLDHFFATVSDADVDIRLAYDPSRSTILLFVNRPSDPVGMTHYQFHIPTAAWWVWKTNDTRMDVLKSYCTYQAYTGERIGLWLGFDSGRISTQPTSGVVAVDGSGHANPLRAGGDNSPIVGNGVGYKAELAWTPINSGVSNQRLLMTEICVLMDTHAFPDPLGTKVGPTLFLYGANQAQVVADVSTDIILTESRLQITGGGWDEATEQTETAITGGDYAGSGIAAHYSRRGTMTLTVVTNDATLNDTTLTFEDATTTTHEITFDTALGISASTASVCGIENAIGDSELVLTAIKTSLDAANLAGLIALTCDGPSGSTMLIRADDEGVSDPPALTGTAVTSGKITAAIDSGAHVEFITGGLSSLIAGTYNLVDDSAADTEKSWAKGGYRVKRTGSGGPDQWLGYWGVFEGDGAATPPSYIAGSETNVVPESVMNSVEILPSGYTRSTATVDTDTEDENKTKLAEFTLVSGRNNRYRIRKRQSDFQIEIESVGTSWVLEDIAATLEQGGQYRTVLAS